MWSSHRRLWQQRIKYKKNKIIKIKKRNIYVFKKYITRACKVNLWRLHADILRIRLSFCETSVLKIVLFHLYWQHQHLVEAGWMFFFEVFFLFSFSPSNDFTGLARERFWRREVVVVVVVEEKVRKSCKPLQEEDKTEHAQATRKSVGREINVSQTSRSQLLLAMHQLLGYWSLLLWQTPEVLCISLVAELFHCFFLFFLSSSLYLPHTLSDKFC